MQLNPKHVFRGMLVSAAALGLMGTASVAAQETPEAPAPVYFCQPLEEGTNEYQVMWTVDRNEDGAASGEEILAIAPDSEDLKKQVDDLKAAGFDGIQYRDCVATVRADEDSADTTTTTATNPTAGTAITTDPVTGLPATGAGSAGTVGSISALTVGATSLASLAGAVAVRRNQKA